MRTIASSPRAHKTPGAGRFSGLGALCLGVLVGALIATDGWLAVALMLLALLTLIVTLVSGERLDLSAVVTVPAVCAAAGMIGGWLARRIAWRRGRC